ncbi:hypothetical protein ABZ864_11375 [Streptomyces sp. NPDC047082]|uniref:hypothetical protein n=1 Tax=Streptomyces sp. NPDC047082 TaxID=3155259 RepID=UPI0033E324F7
MGEIARRIAAAAGHGNDRAARLPADTIATADACTVDPVEDLGLGRPHFPGPAVVGALEAPNTRPACRASAPRPASCAAASTLGWAPRCDVEPTHPDTTTQAP